MERSQGILLVYMDDTYVRMLGYIQMSVLGLMIRGKDIRKGVKEEIIGLGKPGRTFSLPWGWGGGGKWIKVFSGSPQFFQYCFFW